MPRRSIAVQNQHSCSAYFKRRTSNQGKHSVWLSTGKHSKPVYFREHSKLEHSVKRNLQNNTIRWHFFTIFQRECLWFNSPHACVIFALCRVSFGINSPVAALRNRARSTRTTAIPASVYALTSSVSGGLCFPIMFATQGLPHSTLSFDPNTLFAVSVSTQKLPDKPPSPCPVDKYTGKAWDNGLAT